MVTNPYPPNDTGLAPGSGAFVYFLFLRSRYPARFYHAVAVGVWAGIVDSDPDFAFDPAVAVRVLVENRRIRHPSLSAFVPGLLAFAPGLFAEPAGLGVNLHYAGAARQWIVLQPLAGDASGLPAGV